MQVADVMITVGLYQHLGFLLSNGLFTEFLCIKKIII